MTVNESYAMTTRLASPLIFLNFVSETQLSHMGHAWSVTKPQRTPSASLCSTQLSKSPLD